MHGNVKDKVRRHSLLNTLSLLLLPHLSVLQYGSLIGLSFNLFIFFFPQRYPFCLYYDSKIFGNI